MRIGEQGSPPVPYVSVVLHGLLQGIAGQLGLCPVPQPSIQDLQVGLHAGAPREVLQRGERGEETQTPPEQQDSPSALPARQDGHWAEPVSSMAAGTGGQHGPTKVSVPSMEGLGITVCPPYHREAPVCMFRLQTSSLV